MLSRISTIANGYRKYRTGAENDIIFDSPIFDTSSENTVNEIAHPLYPIDFGNISEKVSAHAVIRPIAVFIQQNVTVSARTIIPALPR